MASPKKSAPARKASNGKSSSGKAAAKKGGAPAPHRWSQGVTETSDAMDLKPDVFKEDDPVDIAKSLKASAEHSDRRKSEPFRSAMSMLNFYINRAGHNLEPKQRRTLEKAKDVLRELYGRDAPTAKKAASKKAASRKAEKAPASTKKAANRPAKKGGAKTPAAKKAKAKAGPVAAKKTRTRTPSKAAKKT